jgi:hypothetical protein
MIKNFHRLLQKYLVGLNHEALRASDVCLCFRGTFPEQEDATRLVKYMFHFVGHQIFSPRFSIMATLHPEDPCEQVLERGAENVWEASLLPPSLDIVAEGDISIDFQTSMCVCAELDEQTVSSGTHWGVSAVSYTHRCFNSIVPTGFLKSTACIWPRGGGMLDPLEAAEQMAEDQALLHGIVEDGDEDAVAEIEQELGAARFEEDEEQDDDGLPYLDGGRAMQSGRQIGRLNIPGHWNPPCYVMVCSRHQNCQITHEIKPNAVNVLLEWCAQQGQHSTADSHCEARPPDASRNVRGRRPRR